jgi:Glycosyltransferase family 87
MSVGPVADAKGAGFSDSAAHLASLVVRLAVGLLVVGSLLTSGRIDLLHPTTIATDPSNYAAAGQRIAAGNELYALSAGDRPVAADNPPYWTVALLSPPGAAIVWAPAALLGISALAMILWWVTGTALTFAWTGFVVIRGSPGAVILAAILAPMTAITAISGNLNAFLMMLMVATWYLSSDESNRPASFAAGLLVALGAWVKLTPLLLLPWLIATRRWTAVSGTLAGLAILGAAGVAIVGWDDHVQFLTAAVAGATSGVTGAGLEPFATLLGLPDSIAQFMPAVIALASICLVIVFRDRPGWAFVGAVAGAVMVTPVIRAESYSVLLAAAAPWVGVHGGRLAVRPRVPAAVGVGAVGVVLAGSTIAVAQAGTSSFGVRNEAPEPVIVRFAGPDQSSSFGFEVSAGTSGWAWTGQAGQFVGDVIVFDAGCHQLLREAIPGPSGILDVAPSGQPGLSASTTDHRLGQIVLPYVTQCQEEFGPAHP